MKWRPILLAVAIVLVASFGYADCGKLAPMGQGHGYGMTGRGCCMTGDDCFRPGMLLKWADKIGLDQNQKDQLDKLAQENGLARIEKKAELEKAQLKLKHLKMNDGPEDEVLKTMDKVGMLKTEMHKMAYRHRKAVKSILSEEQLDTIKKLRKECRGTRRASGWGHGSGKGGESVQKPGMGCGPHGGGSRW